MGNSNCGTPQLSSGPLAGASVFAASSTNKVGHMKHLQIFLLLALFGAIHCNRDSNPLTPHNNPTIDWEGHYPQTNSATQNEILISSDRFLNTSFAPSVHILDLSDNSVRGLLNYYFTSGASWSPRRWKIIFQADTGWYKSVTSLFKTNWDGTDIKQISPKGEQLVGIAAWSPDGQTIAYIEIDTTNQYLFGRVKLMNPDGSNPHAITGWYGQLTRVTWSADSKQLVFGGFLVGGGDRLYIVNADGTGLKELFAYSQGCYFPSWSPDGRLIAFSTFTFQDSSYFSNIFTFNVTSHQITQLTKTRTFDYTPTWSADSKSLVYQSQRPGLSIKSTLNRISLDGTDLVQLTDTLTTDYQPCWYK